MSPSIPSVFGYRPDFLQIPTSYRHHAIVQNVEATSRFVFHELFWRAGNLMLTNAVKPESRPSFTLPKCIEEGFNFTISNPRELAVANLIINESVKRRAITEARNSSFYKENVAKLKVVDFKFIEQSSDIIKFLKELRIIDENDNFNPIEDTETNRKEICKKFPLGDMGCKILETLDCLHYRTSDDAIRHNLIGSDILSSTILSEMSHHQIPWDIGEPLLNCLYYKEPRDKDLLRQPSTGKIRQAFSDLQLKFYKNNPPDLELQAPERDLNSPKPLSRKELADATDRFFSPLDEPELNEADQKLLDNFATLREEAMQNWLLEGDQEEKPVEGQQDAPKIDKIHAVFERHKHLIFKFIKYSLIGYGIGSNLNFQIKWSFADTTIVETCQLTKKLSFTRRLLFESPYCKYKDLPYVHEDPNKDSVLSVWNSFQPEKTAAERDMQLAQLCLSLYQNGHVACTDEEKGFLVPLVLLIFGVETSRDRASFLSNYILMQNVAAGILSFEDALKKMPMAPIGAVSTGQFVKHITSYSFDTLSKIHKADTGKADQSALGPTTMALSGEIAKAESRYQEIGLQAVKYYNLSRGTEGSGRERQFEVINELWQEHPLGWHLDPETTLYCLISRDK